MSAGDPVVLVACEYSGAVRDRMTARGLEALSVDLLPAETPGPHYQGDVRDVLAHPLRYLSAWPTLMVCHPPCTDLAVSGAKHFAAKKADGRQAAALEFIRYLFTQPIARIALENPVSVIASWARPADQYLEPWQFGHGETKKTGFWLKNLPPLVPTNIVDGREARVHNMSPGPDRWKERSRTYPGIAQAIADQWGSLPADISNEVLFT